jgi:hypothetical protein
LFENSEREEGGGENGNIVEVVNFFKASCTYEWNYHSENSPYYKYIQIQITIILIKDKNWLQEQLDNT